MAFHFKEFSVDDSACAMKVGTDSVLLGAWTDFSGCSNILDIGTGCGLLALMAAQESNAVITAIDIDEDACIQAKKNFSESPWSDRLLCIPQGLEEFTVSRLASKSESGDHIADSGDYLVSSSGQVADSGDRLVNTYDHIITNPPYFINSLKSPDIGRNTARHNDGLPLKSLLEFSFMLLSDSGKLSMVFPYSDSPLLISLAAEQGFNLVRQCLIIPKEGKEPNRILLAFTKGPVESQCAPAISKVQDTSAFGDGHFTPGNRADQHKYTTLTIRDCHGKYTQEYINLTARFYLSLS